MQKPAVITSGSRFIVIQFKPKQKGSYIMDHTILTFLCTKAIAHKTHYQAYSVADFSNFHGDKVRDFQLVTPDQRQAILLNAGARKAYDSIAPDDYSGEVKKTLCGVFQSSTSASLFIAFDTRSGFLETHECMTEHAGIIWLYKNTPKE